MRTIRDGEARYNPMAYHNGSIWPHDTALVALGLARYGLKDASSDRRGPLGGGAAVRRCADCRSSSAGFRGTAANRRRNIPTACAPQAWASASAFLVVQALLGLEIDGRRRR